MRDLDPIEILAAISMVLNIVQFVIIYMLYIAFCV